jgi:hypothetical protein
VFVQEFQESLIPSAIPSEKFIDWQRINSKTDNYKKQIDTIVNLKDCSEHEFTNKLADALMEAEDTRKWLDFYFELLGERGNKYSSFEGVWKFYDIQRAIDSGDREAAKSIADILQEIGLQYIVNKSGIQDHYRGMQVGMESHKRKNRQGSCFENLVSQKVKNIKDNLIQEGYDVSMDDEYKTEYNDNSGQNKIVDFALFENGKLRIVFEANAYKTGGSKPSEIRRSYNYVAQRMNDDRIAFVWITDGQGWAKSLQNVLRDAYDDITDIYNLHQAEQQLPADVERFVETGEV